MLLTTASATVLGLAALVVFAGHNAIFADDDDDEGQEKLIKLMDASKINLQQGLAASDQQGPLISAKFEVDEGKLQLSVYTAKEGKFFEVLVNYATGKVLKIEPITEGDDLVAATSQSATMAKAKTTLKEVVDKAVTQSAKVRAVSAVTYAAVAAPGEVEIALHPPDACAMKRGYRPVTTIAKPETKSRTSTTLRNAASSSLP